MRETQVRFLGWEDPPGKGIGNPLQYSCLENSVDGWRSQLGYSPWGRKESDKTERLHFKIYKNNYKEERCLMHPKANPNAIRPWGCCSRSGNPLGIQRAPSLLSHSASVYLLFSFLGPAFSAQWKWKVAATVAKSTMSNFLSCSWYQISGVGDGLLSLEHSFPTKLRPAIGSCHKESSAGCPL